MNLPQTHFLFSRAFVLPIAVLFMLPMASTNICAQDIAEQARLANAAIARYHGEAPMVSQRKIHVAYFLPSDREPAKDYRERLTRVLNETADFYAAQLEHYQLRARRISLDLEADGLLRIHLVRGRHPWTVYNTKEPESGQRVHEECLPVLREAGIDVERETVAVFTAIMDWNQEQQRFRQRSPYQGGGDARAGFCWQIDAPILDPLNLTATSPTIDDGEYGKVSLGRWNSLFVGGVIHELGHALGLPHNAGSPKDRERGTSLMGSGNQTYADERRQEGPGTYLTFADGLRLIGHPCFTGSTRGLAQSDGKSPEVAELSVTDEQQALVVKGRVTAIPEVYGIVAYVDPEGHGDYDALTWTATPDTEGRFLFRCDALPRGRKMELRLTALQVNGLTRTDNGLHFSTDDEGQLDIDDLQVQVQLAPIRRALQSGRHDLAARLTKELPPETPAYALAAPMLTPPDQRPMASTGKEVSLCDLRPVQASVGWRGPAFDYSPEDLTILIDGNIEHRGIYAHAPSTYRWELDGTWKRFRASCTLRDGYAGSVLFIVKADGEECWRSGVLRQGMRQDCGLDLSNCRSLELIVEDGEDNNHSDHAYWIAPVLSK